MKGALGGRVNLLIGLAMAAAAAGSRFMQGQSTAAAKAYGAPTARNGGRHGRGMAAKRASVKARNVKRHRAALRRST